MKYVYPALFTPYDGGYTVRIPDVPGCVTGGKDVAEALMMARDALAGCLCVYEDEHLPIDLPSDLEAIERPAKASVALIDVDTTEYRRKTDTRAVRKNVTIPAWLSYQADLANLNLSQTLQEAIKSRLGL